MKFERTYPKYELTLPSTNKKVYFRPFLVSDEKNLLLIKEEKNPSLIMKNVLELIDKCFDNLSIENITLQDIEYMFCNLRAKSVGEIVKTNFTCPITNEKIKASVDLTELQIGNGKKEFELKLSENYSIQFKQPTVVKILSMNGDFDVSHLIKASIEKISKEDSVYNFADLNSNDIDEILNSLTKKEYNDIKNFILNLPKIHSDVKYQTSDGIERTLRLDGVLNFFTLT
jgi:hypothetical protein